MSLGWFLIILALVLALQSLIYGRWGLSGLSYRRWFSTDAVFEGEEAEMVEQIKNRKLLPLPWLRIEARIHPSLRFSRAADLNIKHDEFHTSIFSLMPYTGITRRHRVLCMKRGCYRLRTVALTCGDAFGLKEITRDIRVDAQLLVYPRLIPADQLPFPCRSFLGDVTVKRWIIDDPFYLAGIREYRPGDPLNRISWKATARINRLLVNDCERTADPRVMIYLNIDIDEGMWNAVTDTELVEKGISYSASLAALLLEEGIPTGFGSNAHLIDDEKSPVSIAPAAGRDQLGLLLETMALMEIERSMTFHTFLSGEIETRTDPSDILIITAYTSDRMMEQVKRLEQKGHSVQVCDLGLVNPGGEQAV